MFVAFFEGHFAEGGGGEVEAFEVIVVGAEEGLEGGDVIVIGGDGVEFGVVDGVGEPGVVFAAAAPLGFEAGVIGAEAGDEGLFAFGFGRVGEGGVLVGGCEFLAGGGDEFDELVFVEGGEAEALVFLGLMGGGEPAADAFKGDGGGEGFVEIGVAIDKEALVAEFVEDDFGEVADGFVDEGVEEGIAEPAEGGVGFDAANVDVPAFGFPGGGVGAGGGFGEVAAVAGAADDGEPPGLGLEGEGRRDVDVPDDEAAMEIDIFEVAVVDRELELAAGEVADLEDGGEFVAQGGGGCWCRRGGRGWVFGGREFPYSPATAWR